MHDDTKHTYTLWLATYTPANKHMPQDKRTKHCNNNNTPRQHNPTFTQPQHECSEQTGVQCNEHHLLLLCRTKTS